MADGDDRPDANADGKKDTDGNTEKGKPENGPKEGEAKQGGPHKDAGKGPQSAPGSQEHLGSNVYQNFYGDVHADGGTFGNRADADGAGDQHGKGRAEGPLEESVITAIVRAYARPACYEEAAQALVADRVVVLSGETGTGRRAGAIAMLDDIRGPGKPLVRINPSTTLEALASRDFSEGATYLIIDKFAEHIAPELAEYHWEEVCRKIRKARAHLVVTTAAGSMAALPNVVSQFPWHRPDAADALRAHLGAALVADDVLAMVSEALGTDYPLADIGRIARRIAAGDEVAALLDEILGSGRSTVKEWLRKVDAAIPAVMEVATLAFVLGATERAFEDEASGLKLRLAEFAPHLNTESKKAKTEIDLRFRQLRQLRADHPLLTIQYVPVVMSSGSIAIRHVTFRAPEYRQHIIAELWNSLDREFWCGIRYWLHRIAEGDDYSAGRHAELMNSAAIGLSLLGLVAPDEIIDSYLNPWTRDDASLSEQTMAVYVVWRMSMLERLSPLALRIAILWAGQGTKNQRRLAAYAFSGELGARYPVEATKRLSQLADQGEPLVTVAFAQLFATLAEQEGDAVVVLRELRRLMFSKKDRPSAGLVVSTIAELLAVREFRSGRSAVAVFVLANPEHAAVIGPLWARALYLRPWRDRAIAALLTTVQTVAHRTLGSNPKRFSETDAAHLVRPLGASIGQALPELERVPLRNEIMRRVEQERLHKARKRRSPNGTTDSSLPANSEFLDEVFLSLLEILLNAIVNPSPRELEK